MARKADEKQLVRREIWSLTGCLLGQISRKRKATDVWRLRSAETLDGNNL